MKFRLRMTCDQLQEAETIAVKEGIAIAECGTGMDESTMEKSFSVKGTFCSAEGSELFLKNSGDSTVGIMIQLTSEPTMELIKGGAWVIVSKLGEKLRAVYLEQGTISDVDVITVSGNQIQYHFMDDAYFSQEISHRTEQCFGSGTTGLLKKLKIGIAGLSGTGSIVAEQLLRLGVGELVVVDDDIIEERNLNRILNSSYSHVKEKSRKVEAFEKYVQQSGLSTQVTACNSIVSDATAIHKLSQCDVLFGCLDSVDGRHHLNLISTYYTIPYFDVGVKLVADGNGGIDEITTAVHYVQPGESSLLSRHVYSVDTLSAASLKRENPEEYQSRLQAKYIMRANEGSPAVISVNMVAASIGVMEFLARVHSYRASDTYDKETFRMDLIDMRVVSEDNSKPCPIFKKKLGWGDTVPLIGLIG